MSVKLVGVHVQAQGSLTRRRPHRGEIVMGGSFVTTRIRRVQVERTLMLGSGPGDTMLKDLCKLNGRGCILRSTGGPGRVNYARPWIRASHLAL